MVESLTNLILPAPAWKNLSVRGVGATAVYAETMGSMFNPMLKIRDKKQEKASEQAALASSEKAAQSHSNLDHPDTLKKNEKCEFALIGCLHPVRLFIPRCFGSFDPKL